MRIIAFIPDVPNVRAIFLTNSVSHGTTSYRARSRPAAIGHARRPLRPNSTVYFGSNSVIAWRRLANTYLSRLTGPTLIATDVQRNCTGEGNRDRERPGKKP